MSQPMELKNLLESQMKESVDAKAAFFRDSADELLRAGEILFGCIQAGGKVLVFGNGGSATDATHFALELVNRFVKERRGLAALSLNADGNLLTCIGNDYSFENVFERQIEALGRPGDLAIGISTSGNSKNVMLGLRKARTSGLKTLALLGGNGGKIAAESLADLNLIVRATSSTPRIQETHIFILHSLCEMLDRKLGIV